MNGSTLKTPLTPDDHYLGDFQAPVVIVEYADFQDEDCARAVPILDALCHQYSSEVCLVFRHFPVTAIHHDAGVAAVATEAAAIQGRFWDLHHALFAQQDDLSTEAILETARELGLDMTRFLNDIENAKLSDRVHADFASGKESGVNVVPTIFVNGFRYEGVPPLESLKGIVEDILRRKETGVSLH